MPNYYTVYNHQSEQTSEHETFNRAMSAIGDQPDVPNEQFTLNFDPQGGAGEAYEVLCGDSTSAGPFFTEYIGDNPLHQTFATIEAMKNHIKQIDDTMHGL